MASFLTRDDGQQEQGEKAAEDSGDIATGGLDVDVNVKQLPHALQELVAQLRAVPPTVEEVDFEGPAHGGNYFRMDPPPKLGSAYEAGRLWVLGLISSCPSLRVVNLTKCRITSESEVERLCQGLKSNALLRWLRLNGNTGFGSDLGCGQVSHILASSSTTLETLEMEGVGMKAEGLSQLVSTLLANPGSRLQALDVENNPECLTDEPAAQLLAQLVSSSSQGLRDLRIGETGLAVDGAVCLSSAFGANTCFDMFGTRLQCWISSAACLAMIFSLQETSRTAVITVLIDASKPKLRKEEVTLTGCVHNAAIRN